eukprot:TRINITY_DN123404_c0_g1_i1.p1 TRINITY_DN123404_c0_g1~~TRINITY_DN123404_c0_g1_i1.p1  ORF type:complete len:481 (+),score=70.05 TRINITY_DN123404_c0_g1_i1:86-1528(+)
MRACGAHAELRSCSRHVVFVAAFLLPAVKALSLWTLKHADTSQHIAEHDQAQRLGVNGTLASIFELLNSSRDLLVNHSTSALGVDKAGATSAGVNKSAGHLLRSPPGNTSLFHAQHAEKLNATANSSSSRGGQPGPAVSSGSEAVFARQPRVYFLFMAVDKVSNLDVWRSFFSEAPVDQYRAFVHCKFPHCQAAVAGSPLIAVPTVPSYYCTDLVSPMNQLLSVALSSDLGSTNSNDRFVFLSDSTLPAKPFWHIYATLTTRAGSDFCIFPSKEWADVKGSFGIDIAVKHHQWVTLTREHAERASALWASGLLHDFMQRYQMNMKSWSPVDNTFADNRNFGCLDEFWYMATLYGPLAHDIAGPSQAVYLPLLTSGPLHINRETGWQGMCDTFVLWSQYVNPYGGSAFDRLMASLDKDSIPNSGNFARPGWWDKISSHGIAALRASEFLFVRKFIDAPRLTDAQPLPGGFAAAYSRLVFGR